MVKCNRPGSERAVHSAPLFLPRPLATEDEVTYISVTSPLHLPIYLPYISPTTPSSTKAYSSPISPLHLRSISPISPLYLPGLDGLRVDAIDGPLYRLGLGLGLGLGQP